MEQRIVSQEENRYIYFIQENNIGFYLAIPRASEVSLTLNLIENIDDLKIKQLPLELSQVQICPVINGTILGGLLQNQSVSFQAVDDAFAKALNLSHQILTYNHLNVNNYVYLNDNQKYSMFNTWFINKYQGRVILKPVAVAHTENIAPTPIEEKQPVAIEQPTPSINKEVTTGPVLKKEKSLGFVSYVLLGVVAAVASLLFLYFIL